MQRTSRELFRLPRPPRPPGSASPAPPAVATPPLALSQVDGLSQADGLRLTDDIDADLSASMRRRSRIVRVVVVAFLLVPGVALLVRQGFTGQAVFLVPGSVVFVVLVDLVVMARIPWPGPAPRWTLAWLPVVVLLATALLAVGKTNWLTPLAVAAAAVGRLAPPERRTAVRGIAACAALGLGVGLWYHWSFPNLLAVTVVPLLAGFLAYGAQARNRLIYRLRETRAELARMAVAEERLRIARDLHDLLGHSLSLIALKAELAGRLVAADPFRAAREIAELEAVARTSLKDVREAVTGYRQPTVAAELDSARRMLAASGIECQIAGSGDHPLPLPAAVDAVLAWTIREGATNIVRHSGATRAAIRVEVGPALACAELTDDGGGPTGEAGGSGLTGLAERAARIGGALSAGKGPDGGFRLRVGVPLPAEEPGLRADETALPADGAGFAPLAPAATRGVRADAEGRR